ncbi:DUF2798 domain-containing protein [Neisseriaceae bacterium JH1-16]|nr:DUF2798 domain-containing protein [Neisseriaceae bacterium JH1-16]
MSTKKHKRLFAILMSCSMSMLMSGVLTALNTGLSEGFLLRWLGAFGVSIYVAFPLSLFGAPRLHALTLRLLSRPCPASA